MSLKSHQFRVQGHSFLAFTSRQFFWLGNECGLNGCSLVVYASGLTGDLGLGCQFHLVILACDLWPVNVHE